MNKNVKKYAVFILVCALTAIRSVAVVTQGEIWPDTHGNHINAHGGCVLYYDGKYYWYGEQRPTEKGDIQKGVNCYSSSDLVNWQPEGLVLAVSDKAGSDIERGCIIERPKVIFNETTGKFVMWFHLELKGKGYEAARAGVAVADSPTGAFRFVKSGRINKEHYPLNFSKNLQNGKDFTSEYKSWSPEWKKAVADGLFVNRDYSGGQMSRDMTLFIDDDGKAYHIYSSEDNLTLQIAELTGDYLDHTGKYIRVAPAGHNEAPMLFKRNGKYWMITSGCTGWKPNEARMFVADSIMGSWTQLPNPCIGEKSEITFGGQGAYVFQVTGDSRHIAMFDIWKPECLGNSRHIWLPIEFVDEVPVVRWREKWSE